MISKIIQKEKDRQEEYLKNKECFGNLVEGSMAGYRKNAIKIKSHKQSLINLKEYMEEVLLPWSCHCAEQIKEDIQELNKMIERYE